MLPPTVCMCETEGGGGSAGEGHWDFLRAEQLQTEEWYYQICVQKGQSGCLDKGRLRGGARMKVGRPTGHCSNPEERQQEGQ